MKRYISSFFIALTFYVLVGFFIFYIFKNETLIFKEIEKSKPISLSQIELKPQIKTEEKKAIEEKIVEEKAQIPKEEPKKEIKKELPKKIIKEVKKKPTKEKVAPIKPTEINEPIKKEQPKEQIAETQKETIPKKEPIITQEKDEKQEYLNKHLAQIRSLINENIIYPNRAKKLNIQGIVTVKFKILEDGSVVNIEVLNGHNFLQKATIEAIENASKGFPKVKKEIELQIPIEFKLI